MNLENCKITVLSEQHRCYYEKANYGFFLIDNINVNNLTCSIKLAECLYGGITPIIVTKNIGDFDELGFDFIKAKGFLYSNLNGEKRKKNNEIIYLKISSSLINIKIELS